MSISHTHTWNEASEVCRCGMTRREFLQQRNKEAPSPGYSQPTVDPNLPPGTAIIRGITDENGRQDVGDTVNHPPHYNKHPSGVECIDVVEHMNFNLGNAIKYVWRADEKGGLEDLQKAAWYITREIERRTK